MPFENGGGAPDALHTIVVQSTAACESDHSSRSRMEVAQVSRLTVLDLSLSRCSEASPVALDCRSSTGRKKSRSRSCYISMVTEGPHCRSYSGGSASRFSLHKRPAYETHGGWFFGQVYRYARRSGRDTADRSRTFLAPFRMVRGLTACTTISLV
jgi:hypothetical protein